jgi:hypothetical protein
VTVRGARCEKFPQRRGVFVNAQESLGQFVIASDNSPVAVDSLQKVF